MVKLGLSGKRDWSIMLRDMGNKMGFRFGIRRYYQVEWNARVHGALGVVMSV